MPDADSAKSPMWCEDFDGDLYRLVPAARDVLAEVADTRLYTTCSHPTNGRINLPSCWNTDRGLASFFGREPQAHHPAPYVDRGGPVVECTVEEIARDFWAHSPHVAILRTGNRFDLLWDSGKVDRAFWALLYQARGYPTAPSAEVCERYRVHVLANLRGLVKRAKQLGIVLAKETA